MFFAAWSIFINAFAATLVPVLTEADAPFFSMSILDLCIDIVYLVAMLMRLRSTIIEWESGRELCNLQQIQRITLHSPTFWTGVVSCIPLHLAVIGLLPAPLILAAKFLRVSRFIEAPPRLQLIYSPMFEVLRLALVLFV